MAGNFASFLEAASFGTLNNILATYHDDNGYAIPNRFDVIISGPTKRSGAAITNPSHNSERGSDLRKISLRCDSLSLPGRNLVSSPDAMPYGPRREVVNSAGYTGSVNMVFNASANLEERVFFEEWQKQTFNEQTWDVSYYNDYIGEIDIYLLDRQDKRRFGIKLHEVYPKDIVATELAQGTNDQIIKTTVAFQYRHWTSLDRNKQPPNLGNEIFSTVINTATRTILSNVPSILNKL